MTIRYFTVEEANAVLPNLRPLVGRVLELRAHVSRQGQQLGDVLQDLRSDVGGLEISELTRELGEIEELVAEIRSYGCVLKSLEAGLLDFLSERDGRDIFLCWRYGEPEIGYYHELHTGFQGRHPI